MSALEDLFSGRETYHLDQSGWDAGVDSNGQVFVKRGTVAVGLTSELSAKIRAGFDKLEPGELRIMNGWLVERHGGCTCGAGGSESGYLHEPGCGWSPVVDLSALAGWPGDAS